MTAAVGLGREASRPAPKFLESNPDQAEGARVLGGFREAGIAGDYWLQFELRVMPRRGPERTLRGEILGQPGLAGPQTRLQVAAPGAPELRYLLHGGSRPQAWRQEADASLRSLDAAEWLEPLAGTDLTVFDLQMPFLRWTDFVFEGVANVRGRPAHAFLLYPPADFAPATPARPAPAAVRVYLDTQFSAPTQAEWVGPDGRVLKSVTVLDLKKAGEQWLVKSIDLRNPVTRDKTRFQVTAAALDLDWPELAFQPEGLASPSPTVPEDRIRRF